MTPAGIATEARRWVTLNTAPFLHLEIDAEPRPESLRAGVRGGRAFVYKGKLYGEFLAETVRQLAVQKPEVQMSGDIIGVIEIIVTKPKATKKARPGGDLDNLAKGVLDGMTQAGIWDDDDSLVSLSTVKRWAETGEKAGVKVTVGVLKNG